MIDVILLTATCHFDNLYGMAENIENIQEHHKEVDFLWVLCVDKYNGTGNIDEVYNYLFSKHITWVGYESGKPGQANYGGDMYNEPLNDVLTRYYKGKDPWVYILDDDNMLCEKMVLSLKNEYDSSGKRIAWMHYVTSVGDIVKVNPYECLDTFDTGNYWVYRFNPDPSAILFKSSVFVEFGGFLGGIDYDFTSVRRMCEVFKEEIIFDYIYDNRYSVYHNGAEYYIKPYIFDEFIKSKNINGIVFLQHNDNTESINASSSEGAYLTNSIAIPILKKETLDKIIELIKIDINK